MMENLLVDIRPPIKRQFRQGDVEITEYQLDPCQPVWNHLAWWVVLQMVPAYVPSPGDELEIVRCARFVLRRAEPGETAYYNPQFTLRAPRPSIAFAGWVHRARKTWLRLLKTAFQSSARMRQKLEFADISSPCLSKREHRIVAAVMRQLEGTGILVVDGKHVPTGKISSTTQQASRQENLIGRTFGRLTVERMLPGGQCLCRCSCNAGADRTVRQQHLLTGATRSCGCLVTEIREEQLARKERKILKWG